MRLTLVSLIAFAASLVFSAYAYGQC